MLPPGSTIGILGTGQLGRMTALAAARLGYRVHALGPFTREPLHQVTDRSTRASWDDPVALDHFAESVDVVTLEFENIPVESVARIATRRPMRPGHHLLAISQDRLFEKEFVRNLGLETAPFVAVDTPEAAAAAARTLGADTILKTRTLGYDGKGQASVRTPEQAAEAFIRLGSVPCILELRVPFFAEASVIVARNPSGQVQVFPMVENVHRNHILHQTFAPPRFDGPWGASAEALACAIAENIGLEGLLTIELFLLSDGRVLVNELAPRPHNSGHWTQNGCQTDQFEQLVRAVCDLPLGPVGILTPTVMTNLIGDEVNDWPQILAEPGAALHLYGKAEVRAGRKMGHVNRFRR